MSLVSTGWRRPFRQLRRARRRDYRDLDLIVGLYRWPDYGPIQQEGGYKLYG